MISLLRKSSRSLKYSTTILTAGSQDTTRIISSYTPSSNIIKSLEKATKSTTGVIDLTIPLRKLSSIDIKNQDFKEVFSDILNDLKEILQGYNQVETTPWLTTVLEYNLQKAEKVILHLTVLTYEILVKEENLNKEKMRLAYILGWFVEMINTAGLMMDDIMDNSTYRRGQPCWHTLNNVGLSCGLNDAFLIANAAFAVLMKNFRHLDCYRALLEIFHQSAFITSCGQCLDVKSVSKSVSSFNRETYNIMAVNKVTYDNFYSPFAAAAQLAGFTDEDALRQFKAIINEIGLFFQIQNDFLDCFGTLETAGKVGTDIQDNKYSWLAVTCMEQANDEQKQIMIECYGKQVPEKTQRVKELYKALDLPGRKEDHNSRYAYGRPRLCVTGFQEHLSLFPNDEKIGLLA